MGLLTHKQHTALNILDTVITVRNQRPLAMRVGKIETWALLSLNHGTGEAYTRSWAILSEMPNCKGSTSQCGGSLLRAVGCEANQPREQP